MKKIGLILLISGFWLLVTGFFSGTHAQEETLTLLTYYPAPYGVYQQFKVTHDGSTNDFVVDVNGNVSIGNIIQGDTTNSYKLHVGSGGVDGHSGFGNPYVVVGGGETNQTTGDIHSIGFGYGYTTPSAGRWIPPAEIGAIVDLGTGGFTRGHLVFATRATLDNVAPAERMRINSAGNVGINTNNPIARLDTSGTIRSTSWTDITSGTGIELYYSGTAGALQSYDRTNSNYQPLELYGSKVVLNPDQFGNNIGINTSNPVSALEVNGTARFRGTANGANPGLYVDSIGRVGIAENPVELFQVNGTARIRGQAGALNGLIVDSLGRVGIGGGNPTYALHLLSGDAVRHDNSEHWTKPSDIRLKKDIHPIENALQKILQLQGVTFKWRESEKNNNFKDIQMGMIGQEVEKVFPQWVSNDTNGYKMLNTNGFDALIVEAVRDLKKEINKLSIRNRKLEARIKALEEKLITKQ